MMMALYTGDRRPKAAPVLFLVLAGALLAGPVLVLAPAAVVAGVFALLTATAAFLHPPVAAYALVALTPLIVGMNRGAIFPVLRPNEGLALVVGIAVVARAMMHIAAGERPRLRLRTVDASLILLVITGSVVPLAWLVVRGETPTSDDILYALALPKYLFIYLIVRFTVRSERDVRRCLWLSLAAGGAVALIGILQSLQLFGVPELLATHYAPYGDEAALYLGRGSSTVAHAQAMADIMVFNLAIAAGLWVTGSGHRVLLGAASVVFVFGSLASGQFSGAIALVVGVTAVGFVTRRMSRSLLALTPVVTLAAIALQPVVDRRISAFSSPGRLPNSWVVRLENLRSHFWPQLFSDFHYVLGIRPAARIPIPGSTTAFVFIESGHTWLLWTGGLPFLAAFVLFLAANLRASMRIARRHRDAYGAAATASFAALAVLAVLTTFDPHLTLRGSADLGFALLALTHAALRQHEAEGSATGDRIETTGHSMSHAGASAPEAVANRRT